MGTLADLFPAPRAAPDDARPRARRSLRGVVGSAPAATVSAKTDDLDRLFDGQPRAMHSALVAPPLVDDTAALQQLVDAARAVAPPVAASRGLDDTAAPRRGRRGRSTRDGFAIGLAVVAVVAVIGTAVLAVRTFTSSSPTADALRTLSQSEAVLVNEIRSVDTSIARFDAALADGVAVAEGLAEPLAGLSGISDEGARTTAETARTSYLAALAALQRPIPPAPYEPAVVDATSSLEQFAEAIDGVGARSTDVAAAAAAAAAVTAELAALDTEFDTALRAFAATVPVTAGEIVAANPDAEESFRSGVTDSAASVAAAPVDGLGASLTAYAQAVAALQADQARALDVIAELVEQQRLRNLYSGGGNSGTGYVEPTPEETGEPDVADPGPENPGGEETVPEPVPDPVPTEPATDPQG